ncbi:hypothetical protein D3C86_1720090 [compost metagenome]
MRFDASCGGNVEDLAWLYWLGQNQLGQHFQRTGFQRHGFPDRTGHRHAIDVVRFQNQLAIGVLGFFFELDEELAFLHAAGGTSSAAVVGGYNHRTELGTVVFGTTFLNQAQQEAQQGFSLDGLVFRDVQHFGHGARHEVTQFFGGLWERYWGYCLYLRHVTSLIGGV